MDENVGEAVTKPLLDKLGGGRGDGRRGEHGQSEERVVRKSRLGPNSLSQQMRLAGHRTPLSHSHPTWPQFSLALSRKFVSFSLHKNLFKLYKESTDARKSDRGIAVSSPEKTQPPSGAPGSYPT